MKIHTYIATWTPELRNPQKVVWPPPKFINTQYIRDFTKMDLTYIYEYTK